jgi:hypothetical protein
VASLVCSFSINRSSWFGVEECSDLVNQRHQFWTTGRFPPSGK